MPYLDGPLVTTISSFFRLEDRNPKRFLLLSQPNFHNCQSWIFSPSIMGYHTKPLALKLDLYVSNDIIFPHFLVFKHYYLLLAIIDLF